MPQILGIVSLKIDPVVTLTYSSNGDTNGLFYYLGTEALSVAFSNPSSSGAVVATAYSTYSGNPAYGPNQTTNRADGNPWHSDGPATWIKFDIDPYRFQPTDYTLKARTDYEWYSPLSDWVLEGSNDNSSWDTLDTRTGESIAFASWEYFTATAAEGYRYLRIRDTSANAHMVINEIEFYGEATLA